MQLTQTDIDFILSQLRLPGNVPVNPLDSTGLRDVSGVGNNLYEPYFGTADVVFPRITFNSLNWKFVPGTGLMPQDAPGAGGFTFNQSFQVVYDNTHTVDYATRGTTLYDAQPRLISNLLANQDGLSTLQVQDNPADTPEGRISPITGNVNPLPYSSFMALFGQFFDHGLDFVHKGADGNVFVPLLPGDSLYSTAPGAPNFMMASRTNTASVLVGAGSTDDLFTAVFGNSPTYIDNTNGTPTSTPFTQEVRSFDPVTGTMNLTSASLTGTLMLNNQYFSFNNATAADLVTSLNAKTNLTGVVASLDGSSQLVLTPLAGESFNTISPYIDLSQSYGSVSSHTVFLREYDATSHLATGRLVSGGADGTGPVNGMATWADVKANALNIGLTLHDLDVTDVPLVEADPANGGRLSFVALDQVTGAKVYVMDTARDALASNGLVLMTTGHAFLDDMAHGLFNLNPQQGPVVTLTPAGDLDINANDGDVSANAANLLNAHYIAGDGRANENIGLTTIHDVFHAEHNRVVAELQSKFTALQDGTWKDANGKIWTGEDLFQAAKLVTEMEYQHIVFGEFARKLSPNINAFAGYDIALDPAITAEFAHAVYRFGHSMLTETVGLANFDTTTGLKIANTALSSDASALSTSNGTSTLGLSLTGHGLVVGNYVTLAGVTDAIGGIAAADLNGTFKVISVTNVNHVVLQLADSAVANASATGVNTDTITVTPDSLSLGLIEAFLNPNAFGEHTAGQVAIGMSQQVGNAIDEWVTPALRDNLVGLPLDLATLNLVRGRDAGVPTLNQTRAYLYEQTQLANLKPYESWDDLAMNLLHPQAITNFIMAYARDAILVNTSYQSGIADALNAASLGSLDLTGANTLTFWNDLQLNSPDQYAVALRAAATAALNDAAFVGIGGNQDFNQIDLWIGGLAEAKVPGGMLGSTFDFVFAAQMISLQNSDRFYYLERLLGTDLLVEIEGQTLADLVMRSTGVKHLYPDIFSVADSHVELEGMGTGGAFGTQIAHQNSTTTVVDAEGITRQVGSAAYVGNQANGFTFYGNSGNYLDARGVFNPNGAGNASEVIGGTTGADHIYGLGGNDALYGEGGNDTLDGGLGNDFLRGGDGDDMVVDTLGDNLLWGEAGDDTLISGIGIDQLFGGDGSDLLKGGLGADVLEGGAGHDVLYGGNGGFTGGTGQVNIQRDANGNILRVTITTTPNSGTAPVAMDGTDDGDVINGGMGNDVLFGGGGADALDGGEGDDWLFGGTGPSTLIGWSGNDRFVMDATEFGFNNIIDGGIGFDTVDYSQSRGVVVNGVQQGININLSNTFVTPPPGANIPDAFVSVEAAIGSRYNDVIVGGQGIQLDAAGNPVVAAGAVPIGVDQFGQDIFPTLPMDFWINGGAGHDSIMGDAGNDTLIGGAGRDTLIGGAGIDRLNGGAGNDILDGGLGMDLITLGAGNDRVVYNDVLESVLGAADRITGFTSNGNIAGPGDKLDLSAIDADTSTPGTNDAFTFSTNGAAANAVWTQAQGANNLWVMADVDGNGSADLRILMVGITSMSANDFVL